MTGLADIDAQIERLYKGQLLTEEEVKSLCGKVCSISAVFSLPSPPCMFSPSPFVSLLTIEG
jgi:hypothetical protein